MALVRVDRYVSKELIFVRPLGGSSWGTTEVSGHKLVCDSLTNPDLHYAIYITSVNGSKLLITYRKTSHRAGVVYTDRSLKYADMAPGKYKCKLIEYVSKEGQATPSNGYVDVTIRPNQYVVLKQGSNMIKVYWKGGSVYARYYTTNCSGVEAGAFDKKVDVVNGVAHVPVSNVTYTSWFSCTFNFDPTKPVKIYWVTPTEVKEFDLNVPAPAKPEEQPEKLPPKLAPSPARKMSGHVIEAVVEDDLVKVSVSVTSDGIGTAVAEITYSKDGVPVKTQKVPFQVAAGQNTKVLVSKMPFCGSFEMTVKLTDQNGNLIGPIWKAAVQCRKATVTPMPVEEKPAGEAPVSETEEPGAPMPVEKLPEEAGEEGGKTPGWPIALAIAAGILAMKGGD